MWKLLTALFILNYIQLMNLAKVKNLANHIKVDCNQKNMPAEIRNQFGLSYYYQRYMEAFGIPILGSMKRACYILKFILAEQVKLRQNLKNKNFRVVIMGNNENLMNLPEFARNSLNFQSNRSFNAKKDMPFIVIGEELVLCDKARKNEPLLNIIIDSILSLNAFDSEIDKKIKYLYENKSKVIWGRNYKEYLTEGIEVYLNIKSINISYSTNIQNQKELKTYDYDLYQLIADMFFCNNSFITSCNSFKDNDLHVSKLEKKCENYQYEASVNLEKLEIDSPTTQDKNFELKSTKTFSKDKEQENMTTILFTNKPLSTIDTSCQDANENCESWSKRGECIRNQKFMNIECKKSCLVCSQTLTSSSVTKNSLNAIDLSIYENVCKDDFNNCHIFASRGDCKTNPHYMLDKCKRSCNLCGDLTKIRDRLITRATTNSIYLPIKTTFRKTTSNKVLTQTSTNKSSNSECYDLIDYCLEYFQNNQCELQRQSMQYYCKKTSNLC